MGAGLATIVIAGTLLAAVVSYSLATSAVRADLTATANRLKGRVEPKGVEPSTS
jgi:hypothetical protein